MGQFEIAPSGGVANQPLGCHISRMTEKKPKRPRDPNQLAKLVVDIATGDIDEPERTATEARAAKAGSVGGPARARALTPEQRSRIASVAAQARWKKS